MKKRNSTQHEQNEHYEGVCPATRRDGTLYYRASLTSGGRHISLGSFSTAKKAHLAYQEGRHILSNPECTPANYPSDSILHHEKWISLINYRDHHIYFSHPIYLGNKMFYYYLSPTKVLKFDMDDLFYYSSHKIMARGNHYFVADYGLQVSIVSRYGIKPYARIGIDYSFLNGDPTDFRRENIEVRNSYHGVTVKKEKGQCVYTVRIHINGNYIVGKYKSASEAAIAYNKAADILKKKGVNKNYMTNYIEGMSPSRYAEIYSSLKISPAIINWQLPSTFQNNQQN